MLYFAAAVIAFLLQMSPVLGDPALVSEPRECGSFISKERIVAAEQNFQANLVPPYTSIAAARPINLYWHVIMADNTLAGGNIPDSQIADQISVLNQDYAGTGISWKLVGTDRTLNESWFYNASPKSPALLSAMKHKLRKGGAGDINVYTVAFRSDRGLIGTSTYPIDYAGAPKDDGVVLLYSTLPGGTRGDFNLGHQLAHESGHWAGLYHTFEGDSCEGPGDYVDDTPAELTPSPGCPDSLDTCPDSPGEDPIHNFMDYSYDVCLNNFTPGQAIRMKAQLRTYRGLKF